MNTKSLTRGNHVMAAESAGGIAAILKIYGIKAVLGMVGAALLYIVLPPRNADGSFNEKEFVVRLACAGAFSIMFGDLAFSVLLQHVPTIAAVLGPKPVDLMVGAPAWWITRAVALWFQRRQGKDIAELARDVKETL
ncbi:hypothetical protein [Herbaspirillum huttiense]|uniref:DUF1622 domain-containing protein n=1 Tax=Herbaspirillum huttiense subsp. lycopersici TaxID=3074428 RepID=A0ABU2EQV1_9BURK|nr:hypothetical protein [Herbaspirillum huttiense]MDR9850197.1 hypothetical protein [Herbaspirillum huttiense SE1]